METTNSKSISSLVFGILSIVLPFIGLIFGITGTVMAYKATREINTSKEKGTALSVAGKVTSIIGICYQSVAIIGIIFFSAFVVKK